MEPQWKIQAQGIGKEAKYEFPGKEGIEAQWFLGKIKWHKTSNLTIFR